MTLRSAEFHDLSGGLNTSSDNEMLNDNEFADLKNVCMRVKGNLRRRPGMSRVFTPTVEGHGQGFFRLTRKGREPILVVAINGKLYRDATDVIDLNEVLDYEYDSRTTDYTIIKLALNNYKNGTTIIFDENNTETFTQITTIDAANQISVADKVMKISISNTLTGWAEEPNKTKIRNYFTNKKIKMTYEVNSTQITIEGLEDGFQTTRRIEGVQFKDKLYIATGTKLIEFDGGEKAVAIEPYKPKPLEALYVGTNALADDPNSYMSDGEAVSLRIDGVTSSMRIGCINKQTTFTVYISKPETITNVQYKMLYKKNDDTEWTLIQDFSSNRQINFTPSDTGLYQLDVYVKETGSESEPARFIVPKWNVTETDENVIVDFSAIQRCNRITLHWNRLILYGDDYGSSMIYISHLNQVNYFPTPNSLSFDNKELEQITALVRYRDMIVAFTPTSIQALYGQSPSDYKRVVLNTKIGCIAPWSAKIVDNYIIFLSYNGIYMLDSVAYTEEQANVTKIDNKIENIVFKDENATALVTEDQYQIFYPDRKIAYKVYYRQNWIWGKDESEKYDINYTMNFGTEMYLQSKLTGKIYRFDSEVYTDDGYVYDELIVSKEYDFGTPFSDKKLKHLKLLFTTYGNATSYYVTLLADGNYALDPTIRKTTIVDGTVTYTEQLTPNFSSEKGTILGTWRLSYDAFGTRQYSYHVKRVSGRFKRLRIIIAHNEALPCNLVSFGYNYVQGRQNRQPSRK